MTNKENELSQRRKLLIKCFVILNLDKTTTMGIMSMLDTPEKENTMLKFLKENPTATEQHILKQLKEITKEK